MTIETGGNAREPVAPAGAQTCMKLFLKLTLAGVALSATAVWADGLQALEQFLRGTQSGSTTFTQTVTSGVAYIYRVHAFSDTTQSGWSNPLPLP